MLDARDAMAIARIANEFRALEEDLPVSYIAVLAYIARHELSKKEAPSQADVSNMTGIARPGMSRIVRALSTERMGATPAGGERPPGARPGLRLIERRPDPQDSRVNRLYLTTRGHALLGRVADIIHTHTENSHGNTSAGGGS